MTVEHQSSELRFRSLVRRYIAESRYPSNASLLTALQSHRKNPRSGLTVEQARWRREEVVRAGYDWDASQRRKALVPTLPSSNRI